MLWDHFNHFCVATIAAVWHLPATLRETTFELATNMIQVLGLIHSVSFQATYPLRMSTEAGKTVTLKGNLSHCPPA